MYAISEYGGLMPVKGYYIERYENLEDKGDLKGYIEEHYYNLKKIFEWVNDEDKTLNYVIFAYEHRTKRPVLMRISIDNRKDIVRMKSCLFVYSIPADDLGNLLSGIFG